MRRQASASFARFIASSGTRGRAFRRIRSALLGALLAVVCLSFGVGSAFAAAPVVSIDPPGAVSYTTVNLTGTIDPQGQSTLYGFEYSTDQVNWSGFAYLGPVDESTPGPKEVSTELSGLVPGTQYWVRLTAMNFIDPEVFSAEPNPSFTTTVLPAPSVAIDPVSAVTTSSAHFSGKINPEAPSGNPAAADVSWHFECSPECPGLEGVIPADSEEHAITADPTGLKPNTEYEVTLVASNAAGPVSAGPEHFTTEVLAPTAETIPAFALVGGRKALLGGRVNPENSQTDYWFEYGTDTGYGISVPVTHDADVGAGEAPNFLIQEIPGLQPSTTYHFRIVAKNSIATVPGNDLTFTTPSTEGLGNLELPDNRAWEKVSPEDKNGWDIYTAGGVASASGNRLVFKSSGGFGDQPTSHGALYNDYLVTRESTGWKTHGISPAGTVFYSDAGYMGFSEELDKALSTFYEPIGRSLDPEVEPDPNVHFDFYLSDTLTDKFKVFGEAASVSYQGGASADLSHVEVSSPEELPTHAPCESTEPVAEGVPPTCVFEYANGALRRASLSTSGAPIYGQLIPAPGTVSNDGSSVYFSSNKVAIYRRMNGSATTQIGQSERTIPPVTPGGETVMLAGEAAHGNRVLLESTMELVNSDQNDSADLYLYDATKPAGERLTLISQGDIPGANAEFAGEPDPFSSAVSGYSVSKDLSRVYFLADNQVLQGQPNSSGLKLYLWEDKGGTTSLRYISTVKEVPLAFHVTEGTLIVSPDGRYLAFLTSNRDTAYDNQGQAELYRYDAETGIVTCASCEPEGKPAKGAATLQDVSEVTSAKVPALRTVSTQGQLFFQTSASLSPRDSNGQQDVYEYESGEPHLLSSGTSAQRSSFLGASETGNDVFIDTTARLVGWDIDRSFDAYDARVGGGLPEPPLGTLACEGDSCQPVPIPPDDKTPASESFNGPEPPPAQVSQPSSKSKPLTRAQKRAKALKACKKVKPKKRHAACEKKAKKRYGRGSK